MEGRPVAVVTGASRGIGRAIALRLAATHRVVAIARDRARLDDVVGAIERQGGDAVASVIDLGRPEEIARALAGLGADVVVNNAGVMHKKPLLDLTPHEWHEMVDVNFSALYHVTHALVPGMVARGGGHVINIASIAGRSAFVGGAGYAATKHAVLGFSESLMLELRPQGVRVSVVMPGSVDTDLVAPEADRSWMLKPGDVADAVAAILAMPPHALIYQVEVRAANPRR